MRNILIDRLPKTVIVAGEALPIRTNFRVGLLFEMLIFSKLPDAVKVQQALRLYYPEGVAKPEEAYRAALWFFSGGETPGVREASGMRRIVDYDQDAPLLFSAFLDQYGIDLQTIRNLHWWKFRALFHGLREEHPLSRVMAIRAMDLSRIKGKEARARMAKLQARYRLEGTDTAEKIARKAGSAFAGAHG